MPNLVTIFFFSFHYLKIFISLCCIAFFCFNAFFLDFILFITLTLIQDSAIVHYCPPVSLLFFFISIPFFLLYCLFCFLVSSLRLGDYHFSIFPIISPLFQCFLSTLRLPSLIYDSLFYSVLFSSSTLHLANPSTSRPIEFFSSLFPSLISTLSH